MEVKLNLTPTDIAAWWGALVATIVIIWDVYKWRTAGPRISLKVAPNMRIMGGGVEDNNIYVVASIVNSGDRPTTITNIGYEYYENWFQRIRRKYDIGMVVNMPNQDFPLPYILNPGCEWKGFSIQNPEIETKSRNGHLLMWISHVHKDSMIRRRVEIVESST